MLSKIKNCIPVIILNLYMLLGSNSDAGVSGSSSL